MKYILIIFAFIFVASTPMWVPIVTDNTMTGIGITDDPLKVDTSVIATPFDIISATRGSEISPAQITADQDNYNPTGWDDATVVRLDGDSGIRGVTSLTAPTTALKPQEKVLMNIGSYPIYFPGEHPDGTAANRISAPQDIILYPKQSVRIVYDATSTRWRIQNSEGYTTPTVFYSWSAGSATAGDNPHYAFAAIGSGTNSTGAAATSLPAASRINTSTNAAWGGSIYFADAVNQISANGYAHLYVEAIISLSALSDGTNTFTTEIQLCPDGTSTTLEQNNTFGIRYSDGINSGKWQLFTQDNAAAEDIADTGVTVAASTLYRISIYVDKVNSELRGYINGSYVGRVSGNIPTTGTALSARLIHLKSVGTTSRTVNLHSFLAGAIYP